MSLTTIYIIAKYFYLLESYYSTRYTSKIPGILEVSDVNLFNPLNLPSVVAQHSAGTDGRF